MPARMFQGLGMSMLECCRKVIAWSPLLILLLASCATDQNNGGIGEEFFFESNGPLSSDLLHLRPDGTFAMYVRMHLLTEEGSRGSWQKRPSGDFEFRSVWMRQVVHGPIRIAGFGKEWRHRLPFIHKEIEEYLRHDAGVSISRFDLEGVGTWDDVELRCMTVPISVKTDSVDRAHVEEVLKAIDEYMRQDNKDVVHARLAPHKEREFLHWLDGGPGFDNRTVDEICRAVDQNDFSVLPGSGPFYRITREEFERGISAGESFKFQPDPRE